MVQDVYDRPSEHRRRECSWHSRPWFTSLPSSTFTSSRTGARRRRLERADGSAEGTGLGSLRSRRHPAVSAERPEKVGKSDSRIRDGLVAVSGEIAWREAQLAYD
jgi:hypothetical protein